MPYVSFLRRALNAKIEVSPFPVLAGIVIGATLMVMLVVWFDSRPPVQIRSAVEMDGKAARSGVLEMRYKFLRTHECQSTATSWLWRWQEVQGEKVKYWVPLGTSFVTLADPAPIVQDFIIAMPLPPHVTSGQWYLHQKFLDYCHLMSPVFGPTVRVTEDVPILIEDRKQ